MANTERTALPPRPRSRKSIAHMPSPDTIDKENVTTDLSALRGNNKNTEAGKKSRSKSIGPGGLDGLIEGSGNARRKTAAAAAIPPVRSILKPTIPLSPLRQIPERKPTGKNAKTDSPKKAQNSGLPGLLDFAMMAFGPGKNSAVATEAEDLPGPFEGGAIGTRVTLRTEEEQQAAAREREEQEQKSADKERRDARRKSLANRRVSFAPEATLHTWDVVEYVGDSTTSSASTNSTRRASSVSAPSPHPSSQPQVTSSDASEPPSTPPDHVEDPLPAHSPAHQRDLHQRKRRRQSSAILPMNSHEPNTEFGSSPLEGSLIVGSDEETFVTADGEENSDSDVEQDEESVVIEDGDDTMNQSMVSARSTSSSNGSSGRLDEALRLAARQAGTQGIDFDENGDLSMEFDNTGSFKPHKGPVLNPLAPIPASQDQENQNPFSPAFGAGARPSSPEATAVKDGDVEMSMDMTKAIGGILPAHQSPLAKHGRRKSVVPNRRQSVAARRRSSGEGSSMGDETMELTMAVGGIQGEGPQDDHLSALDEDEEMTMELTSVIGGLIQGKAAGGRSRRKSYAPNDHQMADQQLFNEVQRRQSLESVANDETMDMTMAVGGIIPSQQEASIDDDTMGMDITQAIGSILPPQLDPRRSQAKAIMEVEADMGELASSPFHEQPLPGSPPKSAVPAHLAIVTSSTGSPSLATQQPRTSGRRSVSARKSTTPRAATSNAGTPIKKPTTPSKQITPKPARPTTPGKTPPQKNITFRSASPKKLFKEELKQAGHTPRSATPRKVFSLDAKTGLSTPSIVLTPKPRRSSGLGVDREGLGSPRVAALLDRRRSIGDDARTLASVKADGSRAIRFEDPRELERELEKEREEEEQRENGRTILEREADIQEPQAKDATLNLKEMIESLTPKKKVAGRKSLHVGAAKGLLGKRPAELDGDDEEERGSAKKLRQSSPVKPVALRPPPSKTETAGRITRSTRGSLAATAGNARPSTPLMSTTPQKDARITTPKSQGKFKNAEALSSAARPPRPFGKKMDEDARDSVADDEVEEEVEEKDEKIHLQEFLNMTSIRFMDLTTTKRRHTTAPNNMDDGKRRPENAADLGDDDSAKSFEKCVVAGACTLPMLELYQHSCHELKKYISEGRSIVREIEADTFEENPPLFREYISAAPDVKFIMDNQFKNVKTHARLLSKAMWYEWRMKLLEGLREGLVRISDGIDRDNQVLKEQEQLLAPIVPRLVEEHYNLESEHQQLSNQAAELASCDQEELTETRNKLVATENDIAAKKKLIQEIQESIKEKDQGIVAARERKQTCLEDIKEAEKIREECRGWSNSEVGILKGSADALEEKYGWTISAVEGTTITMTYRRDLQLVFDIASFLPNEGYAVPVRAQNSPISVTYIADTRELRPEPLSTEKRFFLQNLKAHLQSMHQANTHVKDLLHLISNVWQAACNTAEQIRVLDLCCSTKPQIISDNGMRVESKMLLPTLATKVRVLFNLTLSVGGNIAVQVTPDAKVVYGESLNEGKMKEFLNVRIKGVKNVGHWEKAVEELRGRLVVRGKK